MNDIINADANMYIKDTRFNGVNAQDVYSDIATSAGVPRIIPAINTTNVKKNQAITNEPAFNKMSL